MLENPLFGYVHRHCLIPLNHMTLLNLDEHTDKSFIENTLFNTNFIDHYQFI